MEPALEATTAQPLRAEDRETGLSIKSYAAFLIHSPSSKLTYGSIQKGACDRHSCSSSNTGTAAAPPTPTKEDSLIFPSIFLEAFGSQGKGC